MKATVIEDIELERIAELHDRVEARNRAPKIDRDIWVFSARKLFNPGLRHPCWVCGKFRSIANAHHTVPLAEQYSRGFECPDQSFVWLCPNHHSLAHKFLLADTRSMTADAVAAREWRQGPVHEDLSEIEFEKMMELMHLAGRGPE